MAITRRRFLRGSLATAGASTVGRAWASSAVRFDSDPFTLGVASGYPTPDSVVLWTRLAPSPLEPGGGMPRSIVPVRWEMSSDESLSSVVRAGTVYADPEWAHAVHVEMSGLEAGRDYWYRFTAGDARSAIGRTRTAPAAGTKLDRMRLAVASCQQYEHGYYAAYRHMASDTPDLILHVGDYIYERSWGEGMVRSHGAPETHTLEDYRARYALYKSDPDLAAAHAACPWLVMWDDHEVDNDYADAQSEENDEPEWFLGRRAAAYRAYYEHMPLPRGAVPFGAHMRLHAQRAFGDLASVSMLDQRQHRSLQACPRPGRNGANRVSDCLQLEEAGRTMLGERQEGWLFAQLEAGRARWNLMAQGTVMAHLDEQPGPGSRYWTDSWNGYPAARERLIGFLAERGIANPVVLSGDIHAFMASDLRRRGAAATSPVVASELVTTSISSHGVAFGNVAPLLAENPDVRFAAGEHRGYLRLDLTRERLRADLVALESERLRDSPRRILRSFVIEAGRPGLMPA